MAGLGISDLPLPVAEFDPELASLDARGRKRFELTADAAEEDAQRVVLVRRQQRRRSSLFNSMQVCALRRYLSRHSPPASLASARYMHSLRRRIVGAVWKLVSSERSSPCTATLIPRRLEVRPADLDEWTAARLLGRLRSQLNRTGAQLAHAGMLREQPRGWLLGGVHCEFDPTGEIYQFHYHVVASGHMTSVIDAFHDQPLYLYAEGDRVRNRNRMSRRPLDNLPAPLGYPWQLFWPCRARGDGSDDNVGFSQVNRRKRRLPEPFHTQMLLWLDQQRIEDMTLMLGLRVGRDGLVKTYTDGECCA